MTPAKVTLERHRLLWALCRKLPEDYEPWGVEENRAADCSCGCKWASWLEDEPADWLVCTNPMSHRAGLLTFEHMGCRSFEPALSCELEEKEGEEA